MLLLYKASPEVLEAHGEAVASTILMAHNLKSARQVGKARVSFVFQHEFLLFFNIFKNPTTKSGKSILLSKQHPICGKLIILNKQNHLLF